MVVVNIEKILRNIPTEDKIFRGAKRVKVIKAVDCITAMSKLGFTVQEIKEEINKLLENYKLVRVKANEKNKENVDLFMSKTVNATDVYMWAEEKYDFFSLFIGLSGISLLFAIAMFKAWPIWLQKGVYFLRYPFGVIIGAMLVLIIVRVVVFLVSQFTHPPGLWIYPNLLAECGVLESFVPMYAWNTAESDKKED
jgi:translocation protein SEC62